VSTPKSKKPQLIIEVLEIIIFVFAISWLMKTYVFGFAGVQDEGMMPTLGKYDQVFVSKLFISTASLERGDIAIFLDGERKPHVKRVIGLPGETVEIRNGFTYVNAKPLYEPYAQIPMTYRLESLTVPQGYVYVLNDNRTEQTDSRTLGSIPNERIMGKALFCFWPVSKIKGL
jgi:signal peptidase I